MAAWKYFAVLSALLVLVLPSRVAAQGTAMTGTIIGTVTDNTKAVIPGVTVTVSGVALIGGGRTVVTGSDGEYRFPALAPGTYTLLFELPGFASVTREGVKLALGFTATINAELSPAGLSENVTVSGASPVVDVTSTTLTTNVGSEQLENLTGSRDAQSVMGLITGVAVAQLDVGGSGAHGYSGFATYGIRGQGRGEVEGMVTSLGAGGNTLGTNNDGDGSIFYSDWNSFEDVAVNAVGNTAEMPQPGVLTNVIAKSGGNKYSGKVYFDYQNENWQAHNIEPDQIDARGVVGSLLPANELNRLKLFRDFNVDAGGFIIRDKIWWYAAYSHSYRKRGIPNILDDIEYSEVPVKTVKATYNLTQNNKIIFYKGHSTKIQKNNVGYSSNIGTVNAFPSQRWPSGPWKIEYNAVIGSRAVMEVRGVSTSIRASTSAKETIPGMRIRPIHECMAPRLRGISGTTGHR